MRIAVVEPRTTPVIDEFTERLSVLSLLYYASDAAAEMEFGSMQELEEAIKRAMEIVRSAGLPAKGNFMRVYKGYAGGIMYDWKLSPLAYKLVCLCGDPSNPRVAGAVVRLIKSEHINQL